MSQSLLYNPDQYPFLMAFKQQVEIIKQEYFAYTADKHINRQVLSQILRAKSTIIKPDALDSKHQILPFYIHRKKLIDIIKSYDLTFQNLSLQVIEKTLAYIDENHFQQTKNIINGVYNDKNHGIINVYFSVISPQVRVKLHVNNDPYIHRAYLGLQVPKGDIAMKMSGEIVKWIEDEFVILDVTNPHCPHNFTNEYRITLNIDFLRPEEDQKTMMHLAKAQFTKRMLDNPYGYGLYGTDDKVDEKTLALYGEYGQRMIQSLENKS